MQKQLPLHPWQEAVSGSVAGVASRMIISPFDVVKVREKEGRKVVNNILNEWLADW